MKNQNFKIIIDGPVTKVYDNEENEVYFEYENNFSILREFDERGNETFRKNSFSNGDVYWVKRGFDQNNNKLYSENSRGEWEINSYDTSGNKIYFQNSKGYKWIGDKEKLSKKEEVKGNNLEKMVVAKDLKECLSKLDKDGRK